MIKKLLNKKNLIIVMIAVVIGMFFVPQEVYAETTSVTVSEYLKSSVLGIYQLIVFGCSLALWIVVAVALINMLLSKTANALYILRRVIKYIGLSILALAFLTTFIIILIDINEDLVGKCRDWAYTLSGVDATTNSDEYDEVTLFETSISKAYELKASSGFAGMFMYIILVYFTIRFVIIYVRRYLFVLILMLVGPIVILQNAILKTFSGKSAKVVLWLKELIFNIYIQVFHAFAYSALIGITVRFSDSLLSFIGVILTLIVFASMTVIEHTIRTIFNFVGGSTSVKSTASTIGSVASSFVNDPKGTVASVGESVKGIPNNLKTRYADFKNDVVNFNKEYFQDVKGTINGENIKVTAEEIAEEEERMANPGFFGKVEQAVKSAGRKVSETGKNIKSGAKKFGKSAKGTVDGLKDLSVKELNLVKEHFITQKNKLGQDVDAVRRISRLYKNYNKRQVILEKIKRGTATPEEIELASQFDDENTLQGDLDKMKDGIEKSDDIVATIYKLKGPSPFIMQAKYGGMPVIGMTAIRSSIDLEKLLNGDIEGSGVKKHKRTLVLPAPNNKPVQQVEMQLEDSGKNGVFTRNNNKRYTFKEFSPGAVKTITSQVMLETLMSDKSAFAIIKVKQMIKAGDVKLNGRPKANPSAPENNGSNRESENVAGEAQSGTIRYTSKTTKEQLKKTQGERDYTFKMYKERAKDNKWARYVSANKNAKRKIEKRQQRRMFNNNLDENVNQYESKFGVVGLKPNNQEFKQEQIVTGLIVATSMQYNKALQEVDFKNDTEFQQSLIDNLTKHGIVSEKQMSNQRLKEEVLESLEEKINSLTSDGEDIYYSFLVDITEKAENAKANEAENQEAQTREVKEESEAQEQEEKSEENENHETQNEVKAENQEEIKAQDTIKQEKHFGENIAENIQKQDTQDLFENERVISNEPRIKNKQKEEKQQSQEIKFGENIEQPNYDEFVEDVVEDTYREEYKEYKKEKFEDKVDKIFTSFSTVAKTSVEMTANEVKMAVGSVDEKKEKFENLLEELGFNKKETIEFGKSVIDDASFVKDEIVSGRAGETIKGKAQNAVESAQQGVKNTVENIEQGIKDTAQGAADKVAETVKEVGQAAKETAKNAGHAIVDPFVDQYRIKPKSARKGKGGESETKKEVFIFFVYGEVINQGRYEVPVLPKGKYYTVEYALNKAGWVTDKADLTQINLSETITNGRVIRVNRKPETVDEEEAFEEYKKAIKKVIKEYISENEIKSVEALRKPMHFKSIVIRVRDELDDERLDKEQIRGFVERCVKELEAGDKALNMSDEGKKKIIQEQKKKLESRKLEQQLEAAEQEKQQKEIEEQANNAVAELFKRKSEVLADATISKRAEVEVAKRLYMENDATNIKEGNSMNDEENV